MRAAALALLLALPARAQDPPREVIEVESGILHTLDGGTVEVMGGAYLTDPALLSTGRELAGLRAQNEELRKAPVAAPTSIAVAVLIGLALGTVGGVALSVWIGTR